jgi:glycosyltransferase involved in cell wall biosynthesis
MKFSVVITTYNRLNLLRRAIDSARSQTIPCEIVVADDCSTDGTEEYVRSLASDNIVYHRNATNKGHAETVNAGVAAASGDWIKPIDDDDYLHPEFLEEMQNAIAMRPEAVICSCQAAQVDENEVELSRTSRVGPGKVFYIPQADIHYGMLLEQVPFGTPVQVLFQKDAFLKTGGWDSSLDGNCDDIDSWIKIVQFGDALFINRCLAYRTVWPGGGNQKISFKIRLDTNILMKRRIYELIDASHRDRIPKLSSIENYVRIHWGFVALKQKKIPVGLQLMLPAAFSSSAWNIFFQRMAARRGKQADTAVRKIVLQDT